MTVREALYHNRCMHREQLHYRDDREVKQIESRIAIEMKGEDGGIGGNITRRCIKYVWATCTTCAMIKRGVTTLRSTASLLHGDPDTRV